MNSRFLLTLLQARQLQKPQKMPNRDEGFSLAVVLVTMLAVLVSSVALANRTQTGLVTASVSGSNREAREVADAGITYVISEWNRPENRGMFTALQPMTAWKEPDSPDNKALRNPCRDNLVPTASGTSQLTEAVSLDSNRKFKVISVTYRNSDGSKSFSSQPNDSSLPVGIQPNDVDEVEITVEGSYERGNVTAKTLVTKRIELTETLECDNSESKSDSIGVFAFGGLTPESTPALDTTPTYYFQNGNQIGSQDVEQIYCSPIGLNSDINQCKTESLGTAKVPIKALSLSASEKEKRNPPQISDISNIQTSPKPINGKGNEVITIKGTTLTRPGQGGKGKGKGSNASEEDVNFCFLAPDPARSDNAQAAHCNVSSITLGGTSQLIIDTSDNPIYLYVDGDITLSGTSDVLHKNGSKDVTAKKYSDLKEYEEDSFSFQIRGNQASSASTQKFSFDGVPSANMLYWAPAADLTMKGNVDLSSALFVNSLSVEGSSRLRLISAPGSFGFNLGETGEEKRTVAGRSIIYSKYF